MLMMDTAKLPTAEVRSSQLMPAPVFRYIVSEVSGLDLHLVSNISGEPRSTTRFVQVSLVEAQLCGTTHLQV